MVKLSKNEQRLYDHIKDQGREVRVCDLASWYYRDRRRPKNDIGSISAMLRTIVLKAEVLKLPRLVRTSRLGVSSPGVYKVER